MRLWPLLIVALLASLAALWTWTREGDPALALQSGEVAVPLVVLDNGFHTDLALPREALDAHGGPLAAAVRSLGPGDWILIGWGDAKFYVDQSPMEGRLLDGARAFFRPGNPSVLMLDPYRGDPRRLVGPERHRTYYLSPSAMTLVSRRIAQSMDLADGEPRVAAARPDDDARFFASVETFSILHLCNHWAADKLNGAGLAIRPARSFFSAEVLATVDRTPSKAPAL